MNAKAMAGAVERGIYAYPEGVFWRLPKENAERILHENPDGSFTQVTPINVLDRPQPWHVAALREGGIRYDPREDRLLGIWTKSAATGSRIDLFSEAINAHGADPVDVAIHEIGHAAFDEPDFYGHEMHTNGMFSETGVEAEPVESGYCPFCALDTHLADVTMNLDGLRQRSHLQHRIPPGLGGRIPEARAKLNLAMEDLQQASGMMPDRAGQARMIAEKITATQDALVGSTMSPDDVTRAYKLAYAAWDAQYDFGHVYQLRRRGLV